MARCEAMLLLVSSCFGALELLVSVRFVSLHFVVIIVGCGLFCFQKMLTIFILGLHLLDRHTS